LSVNTHFNKILIKGNVDVFITQGLEPNIKVCDNYFGKDALTQIEDGVLRITSYDAKRKSILITVTNLQSIEAYNDVQIYSINKIKSLDLQVSLNDNAVANLNLDAYEFKSKVKDYAKLILRGNAEVQDVKVADYANLDLSRFLSTTENVVLNNQASITLNNQQQNIYRASVESKSNINENDLNNLLEL